MPLQRHIRPMKKNILFLTLCLLCTGFGARAQDYDDEYRTFYGGLVAGTNFTQVDGDNFAGYHKVGFNVGGMVYTKVDEHIAVSMEVLYAQKGAKSKDYYTVNPGLYITNYGITLNYAEVPIMVNYFDKHRSFFGGGLSYSRLGTAKEYLTTSPSTNINLNDFPFKKSDYNFLLSGSLHCWKGLFLNIRFQYSLISIRDNTPQNYARGQQFNNMWTTRLMYLF